eukprot:UN24430
MIKSKRCTGICKEGRVISFCKFKSIFPLKHSFSLSKRSKSTKGNQIEKLRMIKASVLLAFVKGELLVFVSSNQYFHRYILFYSLSSLPPPKDWLSGASGFSGICGAGMCIMRSPIIGLNGIFF